MTTDLTTLTDEELLRQCLEPVVAGLPGGRSRIAAVRSRRFDLATSYDARAVTVELESGETLAVFLKDYAVTVRPKDAPKLRREREVSVYRELLSDATELGTARYYGSVL